MEKGTVGFDLKKVKARQNAYLINGKPAIKVTIDINQDIVILQHLMDVTKEENLEILNKLSKEKVTRICNISVKKAQQELKSDIFGFGETIHKTYPELWKEIKDNWTEEFEKLPVKIVINVDTKGLGIVSNSFFMKEE